MKKSVSTIVLIALATIGIFAQRTNSVDSNIFDPTKFRLEPEKPDVFISYEKTSAFTNNKGEHYRIHWLRIHNNLKGEISFMTYDESISASGKPGIHYEIEDTSCKLCLRPSAEPTREVPVGYPPLDISGYFRLTSGGSFDFGIPDFHLLKNTKLKILFNYPWEVGREFEDVRRPFHFVYFFSSELPNEGD